MNRTPRVIEALRLVGQGMTAYAAARKLGLALSTIYRAQKRDRERATSHNAVK